jgi:uncharacterized protein YeaO (DUF488 family)
MPTTIPPLRIHTSYYGNPLLSNEDVKVVQISQKRPRWRLPYDIESSLPILAPGISLMRQGWNGEIEIDEFMAAYEAQLDRIGPRRVFTMLDMARHGTNGRPLCLMCFENVHNDGELCHRTVLVKWLKKQMKRKGVDAPKIEFLGELDNE